MFHFYEFLIVIFITNTILISKNNVKFFCRKTLKKRNIFVDSDKINVIDKKWFYERIIFMLKIFFETIFIICNKTKMTWIKWKLSRKNQKNVDCLYMNLNYFLIIYFCQFKRSQCLLFFKFKIQMYDLHIVLKMFFDNWMNFILQFIFDTN